MTKGQSIPDSSHTREADGGLHARRIRTVYTCTQPTAPPEQLALGESSRSLLRRGLAGFALAAVGLLVTAPLLVMSAEVVAVESGLSQTFVGTLLVGFTTSFPEIAATVAAVRIGAFDLALRNLQHIARSGECQAQRHAAEIRNGVAIALVMFSDRDQVGLQRLDLA